MTVIIPVYNCEKYLEEAVGSVLSQPYPHIRIILVDDGSADGSPALCDRLAAEHAPRICVIHQKNAGVSAARNAGIERALAQNQNGYLAFLDADDAWAEGFFTPDIVALLGKGYSLIGFQSCICNETLTARAAATELAAGLHSGGMSAIWLHNAPFAAMLYSEELIRKYQLFFPMMGFEEDGVFHMQCAYLADTIWLECKVLHYYRMRGSSAVHTRPYGIPHFVPIIDGWVSSDKAMLPYANEQRGTLREGNVLARIFVLDMIDEHFMMFRKKSELSAFFEEREEYIAYLKSPLGGQVTENRYLQMKLHPRRYLAKQYARGVWLRILLTAQKIKPIRQVREHFRYTIPM